MIKYMCKPFMIFVTSPQASYPQLWPHLSHQCILGLPPSHPCQLAQRWFSQENTMASVSTLLAFLGKEILLSYWHILNQFSGESLNMCVCSQRFGCWCVVIVSVLNNMSFSLVPCWHHSNRNIWDGSLAVEKTISKGNQTVSIVSIIITPGI